MTLKNIFAFGLSTIVCSFSVMSHAYNGACHAYCHPFYVGAEAGYGSTTWQGLVPSRRNRNIAISMFTPKYINEGGTVWGLFAGYEFMPCFALEANYMRYPDAKVTFGEQSLYSFENEGRQSFITRTETASLSAKIMFIIPRTTLRIYSSIGAAESHRYDELINHWHLGPTFGAGINYNITEHLMAELAGSYTGGYGESELNPTKDYFPFLYSAFLRLAYRF